MVELGKLSAWLSSRNPQAADIARPHLDLSGEAISAALRAVVAGAEEQGGIESYIKPLKLKSALFQEVLGKGAETLEFERFLQVCAFMPTVRRRLAPYLDAQGFARIRTGLAALLNGMTDVTTCDVRMEAFCARFPQNKEHRFIRDLAAEVLHNVDIERYPLMTRWVWDAKANTGILREIWFAENIDRLTIRVADDYATFLMLREELAQFLTANGIFRDIPQYLDLLYAQIYAQYICTQGGTYLRTEFSAPEDPMQHTRRMLGLDGVRLGSNRTRLKAIDGQSYVIEDQKVIG
jgi:hypothetical protein